MITVGLIVAAVLVVGWVCRTAVNELVEDANRDAAVRRHHE